MKARLENNYINVYNDKNLLIGGIKAESNFKNSEIKVGNRILKLYRNKWETEIVDQGEVIFHLKTNSFSGNTEILETGQKIKGVTGLKWGTKLIDEKNDTLVKIRNENKFINNNKYEIEISNEKAIDLDILLTLYGHLYGSNMKMKAVIGVAVVVGIISSGILR
jgi:hypothetical protein